MEGCRDGLPNDAIIPNPSHKPPASACSQMSRNDSDFVVPRRKYSLFLAEISLYYPLMQAVDVGSSVSLLSGPMWPLLHPGFSVPAAMKHMCSGPPQPSSTSGMARPGEQLLPASAPADLGACPGCGFSRTMSPTSTLLCRVIVLVSHVGKVPLIVCRNYSASPTKEARIISLFSRRRPLMSLKLA